MIVRSKAEEEERSWDDQVLDPFLIHTRFVLVIACSILLPSPSVH